MTLELITDIATLMLAAVWQTEWYWRSSFPSGYTLR